MTFELVTLDGVKYSDEAYEVLLPTPEGQIAVFKDHAPLISVAAPGVVLVRTNQNLIDEQMESFAITGGLIEIDEHRIRVITDEAEDSPSSERAAEALEQARKLAANADDHIGLADAQTLIDRSIAQLKVAELKKRKRR